MIVAFLFSFLNNEHEQRAKEIVKSILPDAFVSCSSDVVEHDPRIRALLQRGDERLYRPEDLRLSDATSKAGCAPTASRRSSASCSRTAASRPSRIPASCRSACCCPARPAASSAAAGPASNCGKRQHHHHRHRRHLGRHLGHRERRAADQEPARHRGRQPAGAGADDRHRRDRRRRRLDRLYRSGRRVPRRAALGRRRARSGLLRQGRRGADGDRRAGGARPHGPRAFPRRRPEDRRVAVGEGDPQAHRRAARSCRSKRPRSAS